ncbi:MAG: rod shape-determining protein [Desulfurivibrionaceae bacterium]
MLSCFRQILAQPSIAIDLGTANTRIYSGQGEDFSEEPSLIQHIRQDQEIQGPDDYFSYLNTQFTSSPLRGGVIVDIHNAVILLKPLLKRARTGLRHPVSLACAPTDTSELERKLLSRAVRDAGAAQVAIIPEVWAAAIGAGIDVTFPSAQMLIDIGEGVTDMAVIRDGRLAFATATRTACSDLQKAVRNAIISRHKVCPAPAELKQLTHQLVALQQDNGFVDQNITVLGMDIIRRREVSIAVHNRDILDAMAPVLAKIFTMIATGIRKLPEHISCEIVESGICLTGGGSCIPGMDRLIASHTGLEVRIAPDPMHSVINGAIQTLQYWKGKENWWKNIVWPSIPS